MSENESIIDYIYEPLAQYRDTFKDSHNANVKEYFEDLVNMANIDEEANKEMVKQINAIDLEASNTSKKIDKLSFLKGSLIFFIIAAGFCSVLAFYSLIQYLFNVIYVIMIIISFCLIIVFIFFIKKLSPNIIKLKQLKSALDNKKKELIDLAWKQMVPLNSLFSEWMSTELFHKTIPLINFDRMFDRKRLVFFIKKFGLITASDKNHSTLYVQSGDIQGNPFYFAKNLVHKLGTKSYFGSKTIHWTTVRTVNGKSQVVSHSQILTATLVKPCPYYSEEQYLVYGNEAAPDLTFHRLETNTENLSQKQIDRIVNKDIKKLNRLSEKNFNNTSNYTVMANSEFEVLFGAINRNHEVQFRLLFTPLAQKQLLEIMKDKEFGFGDEFDFRKEKKINYIYPKQLKNFNINASSNQFIGYDFEEVRNRFINYNIDYFRYVYFSFAPILAIPLYQQQKPHEFIYQDLYDSYSSFYEHENVVNKMNGLEFKHPLSQTRNILKTSVLKSENNCDTIRVKAFGYRTEPRVTYVSKSGNDGRIHSIPVEWVEYLPVYKDTDVEINYVGEIKEESYAERFKKLLESLNSKKVSKEDMYQISTFVAYVINKDL